MLDEEDYAPEMRRQDRAYVRAVYFHHPELVPPGGIPAAYAEVGNNSPDEDTELFDPDPYPATPIMIQEKMEIGEVARRIADKYRIPLAVLLGRNRYHVAVRARHDVFWICNRRLGYSLNALGRAFSRDHTTILNGVRRSNQRMEAMYGLNLGVIAPCNNS